MTVSGLATCCRDKCPDPGKHTKAQPCPGEACSAMPAGGSTRRPGLTLLRRPQPFAQQWTKMWINPDYRPDKELRRDVSVQSPPAFIRGLSTPRHAPGDAVLHAGSVSAARAIPLSSCPCRPGYAIVLSDEAFRPTANISVRLWKTLQLERLAAFCHAWISPSDLPLDHGRKSSGNDCSVLFQMRCNMNIPISIHSLRTHLSAISGVNLCITVVGISL